ncbi:MAG: 50S ribosomal protein L19 [Gemmataceae bacterium]
MKNRFLAVVHEAAMRKDLPEFTIGDTIDVHQKILEGSKERTQVFNGVVIARRGEGLDEMFTVRRIVQGEGVERSFPLHSPKISKIEVKRTGEVRRAKLYYLRDRVGKATRLRERKGKSGQLIVPGSQVEKKASARKKKTETTEE